jgi:hypothetical protein
MDAPELFNEANMIDVNTSPAEQIDALPEFIKNKMYSSEEWAGRQRHAATWQGPPHPRTALRAPRRPSSSRLRASRNVSRRMGASPTRQTFPSNRISANRA